MSAPPMPLAFAGARPFIKNTPVTAVKQTTHKSSGSALWNVDNLPSLPAAYFLERSHVAVEGMPQEVANKVSECLRQESIATCCADDDKNLLLAETSDCLKFAVRLFADNSKVIVEVQRKCGCSYRFREIARTLLRAAKGCASAPRSKVLPLPCSIPCESLHERERRADAGLQVAMQHLCSERFDSQLIGMQCLEQITRSESRTCVSKKVLSGPYLEKVLFAAQDDASSSDVSSDFEEEHMNVMKRSAMTVVANALSSLTESGDLNTEILRSCTDLKSQAFICCLVETLREFRGSPHEATQAARCIQHLMTDKQVESLLQDMSVASIVSDACDYGATHSALLEHESMKLKVQMRSA